MTSQRKGHCVPKQIIIEATSECNLRCKYCPSPFLKGSHMSMELFESIVIRAKEEMPDATLIPWMNGEPLLHPRYADMLRIIEDSGMKAYVTTNGTIWNDEVFRIIARDNNIYQLIFSLDGVPGSKSIELARPGSNGHEIMRNIIRFGEMKKETKGCDLAVKITRRGQDWGEIEEYIQFWLSQSYIDYVCIGEALIGLNEGSMRRHICQYADANFMVIHYDGRLSYCAYHEEMANNPEWSPGTVDLTTPLLEIYNNEEYSRFREDQHLHNWWEPCATCSFAYTGFGFGGKVKFRKWGAEVYFHRDYYNSFFSLVDKQKPNAYYLDGGKTNA